MEARLAAISGFISPLQTYKLYGNQKPLKLCLSLSNKNGEPNRSLKTHLGEEKENDNARKSTNPRLNSEEYEVEESGGRKGNSKR